jgi:hypothetical protein
MFSMMPSIGAFLSFGKTNFFVKVIWKYDLKLEY